MNGLNMSDDRTPDSPPTATALLREINPYGTLEAVVESDGRGVYFYLNPTGNEEGQPLAVWVRNLVPAPEESDRESMQAGLAPRLRRPACKHPEGLPELKEDQLDLVWFQEGNAAALYIDGEVEAIIPPWSGHDGFFGYARQAMDSDVGTYPFPEDETGITERLKENLEFWNHRTSSSHWEQYRDSLLAHYEEAFGKHLQYYAVTDRAYPPMAVVEFAHGDSGRVYTTLGMSNQSMPGVELHMEEPEHHMRAEIITATPDIKEWMPGLMGRLGVYPWISGSWFGHGHVYESGLGKPDSDLIFSRAREDALPRWPGPFRVDYYETAFLRALPIPREWIQPVHLKGADHVLDKMRRGEI